VISSQNQKYKKDNKMPLTYDTRRIKYFDQNPDKLTIEVKESPEYSYKDLNPETKALVFGAMVTDIGDITIRTASDYYSRWKVMEKYSNLVFLSKWTEDNGREDIYLTPDVIIKHIGLATNVANTSKKDWVERMVKNFSRDEYMEEKPTQKELTKYYDQMTKEFDDFWLA
jgi:hypothetical protein